MGIRRHCTPAARSADGRRTCLDTPAATRSRPSSENSRPHTRSQWCGLLLHSVRVGGRNSASCAMLHGAGSSRAANSSRHFQAAGRHRLGAEGSSGVLHRGQELLESPSPESLRFTRLLFSGSTPLVATGQESLPPTAAAAAATASAVCKAAASDSRRPSQVQMRCDTAWLQKGPPW